MFAHLQDMLRAIDITDYSSRARIPESENYLKKLSLLSRYVTPCPAILDNVGPSNNHPSNLINTSRELYAHPQPGRSLSQPTARNSTRCQFPECNESSDSSDESAWESVPTPTHSARQWTNLIEYEASLLANRAHHSLNIAASGGENNPSLTPHQKSPIRSTATLQAQDVVEVLHSIGRCLEKLGGHSCENATDMFGQYIAHRLSEMSNENRSAAEIEINRVLMKYVEKDLRGEMSSAPVQETLEKDTMDKYKGNKKPNVK